MCEYLIPSSHEFFDACTLTAVPAADTRVRAMDVRFGCFAPYLGTQIPKASCANVSGVPTSLTRFTRSCLICHL